MTLFQPSGIKDSRGSPPLESFCECQVVAASDVDRCEDSVSAPLDRGLSRFGIAVDDGSDFFGELFQTLSDLEDISAGDCSHSLEVSSDDSQSAFAHSWFP